LRAAVPRSRIGGVPKLVIEEGAEPGRAFPAADGAKIGRDATCALRLDDDNASREHAALRWVRGRFYIVDLKSTNGTFVNDQKVKQAALKDGDRVRIGDSVLRFVVDPAEETAEVDAPPSPRPPAEKRAPEPPAEKPPPGGDGAPEKPPIRITPQLAAEVALFAGVVVLTFLVASYATQVLLRVAG
jgi:hypothetical protein